MPQNKQLETIMENYTEFLFRIAYYYTKDVQTSEDIVQEIFIKFYYNTDYQERNELKAYLAKMTTNKCKDYLKSWAYQRLILFKKIPFISEVESFDNGYESSPLEEAVLALPVKIKEVITYFYFEGFSIKEISGILSMNENTVKSRLKRGKELLKERLTSFEMERIQYE